MPATVTGISGDGTGTPDLGMAFQHPDGAAADDGLILMRQPTDLEGEQLAEEEEGEVDVEEDDSDEGITSPQSQPPPPPGLGLILEGIDPHLHHRMAFLRGRESFSGSQDSLLSSVVAQADEVEDNQSTGEALEDESNSQVGITSHSFYIELFHLLIACFTETLR